MRAQAGGWVRGTVGVALAAIVTAGAAGCSDDGGSGGNGGKVASAASSAAASLASQGAAALSSATAEAQKKLDEVKNGVAAKDDVRLGTPTTGGDGRATVQVTAHNTADSAKSFAVLVQFKDKSGNLLDVTVVTVTDVAPKTDGEATATGNRKLSDDVRAEVGSAVRY
ncbi:hypothetical protein LE181_12610 [Streptomyces sp. SCA3-4]|uniref:hypothetical protein n=1 Tax=Streptomyces sichuanensis TaxID=2871810 RepID=UPI001CE3928B|nr:hypothetical protein [Streptomyces sichuanensis]MCA6092999.1 hypothetical protein [Streptomyces sichuanensis]